MDTALFITILTTAGVFVFAIVYSNAGNGGSTGYAATLLLFGMSAGALRPTILALNILVAIVATIRSYRSGFFRLSLFWPLALGSFPIALLVGYVRVRLVIYLGTLALVMLYSAVRLFFGFGTQNEKKTRAMPLWLGIPAGGAIGLVAAAAGIGGGILLSPLLLLTRWAKTQEAIGVAGPIVLVNSIILYSFTNWEIPFVFANMVYWAPAAFIGAWIGSEVDMRVVPLAPISKALSLLVLAGGLKLLSAAL